MLIDDFGADVWRADADGRTAWDHYEAAMKGAPASDVERAYEKGAYEAAIKAALLPAIPDATIGPKD